MTPPDDPPFINPFRRYVRIFLALAAIFFAVGLGAILILASPIAKSLGPNSAGQTAILLTLILCLPLTVSMLISVLFTIPSLRVAERSFAEFREGRYLARWTYSPEAWQAYVKQERRWADKVNWWIFGGVWGVTWIVGIAAAWSGGGTLLARIAWSSLLPGVTLLAGLITAGIVQTVRSRRCNRLLAAVPQAYIAKNAVYCGGEFRFWGTGLRALHGVKLLPGPPPALEFNIGLTRAGQTAFSAVGTAGFAVGRPMPTTYSMRQVVPIPPGAEAQAAELVQTFANQVQ